MRPSRSAVLVAALVSLILAGCAMPGSFAGLNKEQIEAMSKIKDAAVVCVSGNYSVGRGLAVFASVDKGISAVITVGDGCDKIGVTTTVEPKKAPTP